MSTKGSPGPNGLQRIKKRIGELLIEEGLVEESHVAEALSIQKRDGGKTVDIMIDADFLISKPLSDSWAISRTRLQSDFRITI